jgi:hypothetical protein
LLFCNFISKNFLWLILAPNKHQVKKEDSLGFFKEIRLQIYFKSLDFSALLVLQKCVFQWSSFFFHILCFYITCWCFTCFRCLYNLWLYWWIFVPHLWSPPLNILFCAWTNWLVLVLSIDYCSRADMESFWIMYLSLTFIS